MTRVTPSDVYDIDRKTGALRLGKNRLDEYAATFLTHYCPEALLTPMALPVEDILEKEGLQVEEASLSADLDIFGCCLLEEGEVPIYDAEKHTTILVSYPKGTILIDPATAAFRSLGAQRNTLIHEALHWYKDRTYFEILAMKEENTTPLLCRRSDMFYEPPGKKKTAENQVRWLEWQANRLAPRVLMPKEMFKKKAQEILHEEGMTCDALVEELADFFIVSRLSVKYRLQEVELEEELKALNDYEAVFAEIKDKKEYVKLTVAEAISLVLSNTDLKHWLDTEKFVFADGYFVLALCKCVTVKEGVLHLSALAKKNLKKYVLNITEQKKIEYPHLADDVGQHVCYSHIADGYIRSFHPEAQKELSKVDMGEAIAAMIAELKEDTEENRKASEIDLGLKKMIGDPETSICQCLYFIIEKKGWTKPETFENETFLEKDYLRRIRNNVYLNIGIDLIMAICIAAQLRPSTIDKLVKEKAMVNVSIDREPYKTYFLILEKVPGISLEQFNEVLSGLTATNESDGKTLETKRRKSEKDKDKK